MIAIRGRPWVTALLAAILLIARQALAQGPTQLPAQAQTPGQALPQIPAQAPIPANPPDAPVPPPPIFPPPSLQRGEASPAPRPAPAGVPPQSASPGAPLPSPDALVMLVRSTLLAFNQANLTNNYSVLHALAAPAFQKDNDVAKLGESFASFRERKIDVAPIAVLAPRLFKPAEIDGQGLLRIAGVFPSQPLQLRFSLAYQSVEGSWRFAGLAVDARAADATAQPASSPAVASRVAASPSAATTVKPARAAIKPPRRTAKPMRETTKPTRVVRHAVATPRQPVPRKRNTGRRGEPPLTTNYQ